MSLVVKPYMKDDLVQRLRAYPATEKKYRDGVFFTGMGKTIQHEAADAIERLTRERDEARAALRRYGKHDPVNCPAWLDEDERDRDPVLRPCTCGLDEALGDKA